MGGTRRPVSPDRLGSTHSSSVSLLGPLFTSLARRSRRGTGSCKRGMSRGSRRRQGQGWRGRGRTWKRAPPPAAVCFRIGRPCPPEVGVGVCVPEAPPLFGICACARPPVLAASCRTTLLPIHKLWLNLRGRPAPVGRDAAASRLCMAPSSAEVCGVGRPARRAASAARRRVLGRAFPPRAFSTDLLSEKALVQRPPSAIHLAL